MYDYRTYINNSKICTDKFIIHIYKYNVIHVSLYIYPDRIKCIYLYAYIAILLYVESENENQ